MFRLDILFESTPPLAKFSKWSPKEVKQIQGPQCIVDQKINSPDREKESQWGGGIYGYRLKFWLFYGYRLIFFSYG